MAENRKQWFSSKRSIVLVGSLLLVCIAGIVLFSSWLQRGNVSLGNANTIPIADNGDMPELVGGDTTQQADHYGINVGLSDGQSQPQITEALPLATGEPLSPEEIELIRARLPALPFVPDQQLEFNLPLEVLPPPRPGNTVKETFPPVETEPTPGTVEAGALQVSRFAPEGEIPIAPFVSVTFNQPMVPLGTLSELAAKDMPVNIEPSLPGTWRWLGTKTLIFEYDSELIDRLPKATEYKVTVPAGTKIRNGRDID